jgi:hypothetical protein
MTAALSEDERQARDGRSVCAHGIAQGEELNLVAPCCRGQQGGSTAMASVAYASAPAYQGHHQQDRRRQTGIAD